MSRFKKCDTCNEYHWVDERCKPMYFVYHEDYLGEDYKIVRADSYEEAAEKYAIYYNSDDYPLMNDSVEIEVEKSGVKKRFRISAEPSIHYSTEELD